MDKEAYGTYLKSIGLVIRAEREARGWSLREFGLMVGVDFKRLFEIEHGVANPTYKTLFRIAEGIEMTPATLLARAEQESAQAEAHPDTQSDTMIISYTVLEPRKSSRK